MHRHFYRLVWSAESHFASEYIMSLLMIYIRVFLNINSSPGMNGRIYGTDVELFLMHSCK